ncbi:hypothetical protein ACF1FE_26145 [Streptomyces griseofuscus]|uniref:hypothetical protein n=1 Tax=Streptomyces griseofuscus TaxID=146922 RepID=UPI0036F8980A
MPLTGEKYTQLNQPEATTDGADHGRWIACDESGWDGEQLIGRKRRFLVYASVAVDDIEAAALIQQLRDQAGIRQAKELKFDLFKNRTNRWSLLQQLWEPGGALHDRCSVYVVDKEYAAAAKVIDLLLEEKEHDEGGNLYADGEARALARTLALEGPRALRGTLFQELMSAFVTLASRRGTSQQDEVLGVFVAALDQAWAASTRKAVTALLARLRGARNYAATFHEDPADPVFPQLEMLIPAVAQTARRWDRRVGRVSVLTDEQQMLTDDALRTVHEYACAPVGMTLLTRERGADVAAVVRGSSVDHPSIQLADLLAGAAAAVAERHEGNPSDAGEGLWPVITSFVEQSSLLPYDDPAAQLRSVKERPVRR